ncbi:MAG TPA: hypothetical protein VKT75_05730 [Acidobacteriaceae bacterium]|nr:hypothetical protein [Acidobacteriaceae bacterium]
MDLQPGPFLQGTIADVTPEKGVYDFLSDAEVLFDQLILASDDWDAFLNDLPNLAAGPADPTLGIDDVGLLNEIANQTAIAAFPDVDSLTDSLGIAGTLFGAAFAFAPAAAFSVPTDSFNPPDPNATIVVPKIPIGEYTPDVTGLVGTPATTGALSITLQNVTRVGQQNFVVGDTFQVNASGPPNSEVTITGTQNGNDFGTANVGQTDSQGNFTLSGVEGPDAVGQWVENWFIGGQLVATFMFIVAPAGS